MLGTRAKLASEHAMLRGMLRIAILRTFTIANSSGRISFNEACQKPLVGLHRKIRKIVFIDIFGSGIVYVGGNLRLPVKVAVSGRIFIFQDLPKFRDLSRLAWTNGFIAREDQAACPKMGSDPLEKQVVFRRLLIKRRGSDPIFEQAACQGIGNRNSDNPPLSSLVKPTPERRRRTLVAVCR
jgi:hypothetical protein